MRTVNTVVLLGNITKDAELKITSNGKEFATFTIATNREVPSKNIGDTISLSEFHSIVAWGNLAKVAKTFCLKGKLVYLEGYLKTRSWEAEAGKKMYRTEIIATNIIALPSSSHCDTSEHSFSPADLIQTEVPDEESFFSAQEDDFYSSKS